MERVSLEQAVADSDWRAVYEGLIGLDERERAALEPVYRSLRSQAARRADASWELRPRLVQLALAICLSRSPEQASRNCAWSRRFAWSDEETAFPLLVRLLHSRGSVWASAFAAAAAETRVRGESVRGAAEIAALTLPVFARGSDPIPEGALAHGWVQIVSAAVVAGRDPQSTWVPLRLITGEGDVAYSLPTSLEDALAATPRLPEVFAAALRTPDALSEFATLKGPDSDLEAAIRALVGRGLLERVALIDETLGALARSDRPATQRIMATVLRGADFAGPDASARLPLVSHLMPTVHGSVTAMLLTAVLDAEPDDDALLDVGSVILTRKEKAQKQRLLRVLTERAPSPAVEALLGIAAADVDAAFAAKARAVMGSAPPADTRDEEASWSIAVGEYSSPQARSWTPDRAGLDEARSDAATSVRTTSDAMMLDLAVRFAHADLSGFRAAIPTEPGAGSGSGVLSRIESWRRGERRRSYFITGSQRVSTADGGWRYEAIEPVYAPPAPHQEFTDCLVEETLTRLGDIPELLSTPSREDGSLSVDDLEARLARAGRTGAAPYDLVQALLRLEPVPAAEARRFDALATPLWRAKKRWFARSARSTDAAAVVAQWIRAGGLPSKAVSVDADALRVHAAALPLPPELAALDGLEHLCAEVEIVRTGIVLRNRMRFWAASDVASYLGVVPCWTDAGSAFLLVAEGGDSVFTAKALAILVSAPGRLCEGAHHLLAVMQSHPRQDARLLAVQAMATLAEQGRLDAALLREATASLFLVGELSLARASDTWDTAIRSGLLPWVRPALARVLGDALARDRTPAGLPELIRVTGTAFAHATPDEWEEVLPGLRKLAASRSSAKAAHEARALVAALDRVRA